MRLNRLIIKTWPYFRMGSERRRAEVEWWDDILCIDMKTSLEHPQSVLVFARATKVIRFNISSLQHRYSGSGMTQVANHLESSWTYTVAQNASSLHCAIQWTKHAMRCPNTKDKLIFDLAWLVLEHLYADAVLAHIAIRVLGLDARMIGLPIPPFCSQALETLRTDPP